MRRFQRIFDKLGRCYRDVFGDFGGCQLGYMGSVKVSGGFRRYFREFQWIFKEPAAKILEAH